MTLKFKMTLEARKTSLIFFQVSMKTLCLLFTIASIINVTSGSVTFSKFLENCDDWSQPFIDQETHESYKNILMFEAKQWNIKLYDKKFTYLNSTVTIDVHDLISGYYLENAIFKNQVLKFYPFNDLHGFTKKEKVIAYKIRQIMRKYGDFCSTLKASSDQNNPRKVRFPSKIKICTSVCDREVDFCLELKKVRRSDFCNST